MEAPRNKMRVAIIGGGISGLSAAFALEKHRNEGVEYRLYESSSRLGGALHSEVVDGCVVEAGPDSFLTEKPWARELCRELGIEDQIIGSNDADRKTYIVTNGKLVSMPDGLMFMVPTKAVPTIFSRLFSLGTKFRMARELLHPPRPMQTDETVGEMVERHFGREMVDRLADPLLAGVYGGDARRLSARAVLPRFVEMEEKYGSLSRAMLASRKKMKTARAGRVSPPLFSSMRNGMQQMSDALLTRLKPEWLYTDTVVVGVEQRRDLWDVQFADGRSEPFDAVVIATPANVAGMLLSNVDPALAADLQGIPYSSSITVTQIFHRKDLQGLPQGFGFLVPRVECRRILACTFVHRKFPHRAPEDKGIVRCFLGGTGNEDVLKLSDEEVLSAVRQDLSSLLGLQAIPRAERVYRWRGAMAQYESGHLDRVARIEAAETRRQGLALAGNAYHGIGVPDCVRSGMNAAATLLGVPAVVPQRRP